MIYPDKNPLHCKILDLFLDYKFKSKFSGINYHHEDIRSADSQILIGNHTTWWDGFIAWQINRKLLNKDFYLVMLEEELHKLWFFRKVGCFSIHPGSRDMIKSLNFGAELLKDPEKMLVFYPQGKLHSLYEEQFVFNQGIERLLKDNHKTSIIFYSLFIDYGGFEKPYINIFLLKLPSMLYNHKTLQELYADFYHTSKQKHHSLFKS